LSNRSMVVFAQETRVPPPGIESPSLGDQFAQSNVPNCRATTGQGSTTLPGAEIRTAHGAAGVC
jgi:hypothetical protein